MAPGQKNEKYSKKNKNYNSCSLETSLLSLLAAFAFFPGLALAFPFAFAFPLALGFAWEGTALAVDLAFARALGAFSSGSAFFARALAEHFAVGAFSSRSAFFARALAEHFAMGFS